jgi:DNA-binding NarL/FixJ family response regulator
VNSNKKKAVEKSEIRIFLVDDHPIVRQGMRMILSQEPDMRVCGEAESVSEALKKIPEAQPQVAIVDLALKQSSGLELIKDMQIRHPEILVLVLSMRDETLYAERVLHAGARGYVLKQEGGSIVVEGIRKILQGQIFLSEKMASKMLQKMVNPKADPLKPSVENLTDRELAVFELIGAGLPTREIAEKLHLSVKTIDSHREHIKEKLQIDNASELLKHAVQWVSMQAGS